MPPLCVFSNALSGIGYAELGEIAKDLGFDGVDLTVMPGGHVDPQLAPVDEVRALESIHGAGLKAPMISTGFTAAPNPWIATVVALAGRTGVSLFRTALHQDGLSAPSRRAAASLAFLGSEYHIGICFEAGPVLKGYNRSQARSMLVGLPPQWSGLCLQSACFTPEGGWTDSDIFDVLPRVTAIAAADFVWKDQTPQWCPLGKGSVDFGRMFGALMKAHFTGPISLSRDYRANDAPGSLARDAEFLRKQMRTAA